MFNILMGNISMKKRMSVNCKKGAAPEKVFAHKKPHIHFNEMKGDDLFGSVSIHF